MIFHEHMTSTGVFAVLRGRGTTSGIYLVGHMPWFIVKDMFMRIRSVPINVFAAFSVVIFSAVTARVLSYSIFRDQSVRIVHGCTPCCFHTDILDAFPPPPWYASSLFLAWGESTISKRVGIRTGIPVAVLCDACSWREAVIFVIILPLRHGHLLIVAPRYPVSAAMYVLATRRHVCA